MLASTCLPCTAAAAKVTAPTPLKVSAAHTGAVRGLRTHLPLLAPLREAGVTRRTERISSVVASAAAADEPSSSDVQEASAAKVVSIDTWWRSFRYKQKEEAKLRKERIANSPIVLKIKATLATIDAALEPLYVVLGIISLWYNQRIEKYMEFCYMETRRIWAWKRRTEAERAFWAGVFRFTRGLLSTIAYEAFVPVSVLWGIALPLYLAWVLDDNIFASPILWGLLLVAPLKFVPGFIRWV